MTKRKTWIKVKRGLIEPKHRVQLGIRIWLYLHILDRADWETGKVIDWSDKCEADELEIPLETLRSQRRQLEEDGYITAVKGQYSQQIIIHNWTDPRKYDGEVINQSDKNQPLSEEVQSVNSEESLAELEPELQPELYPESLKLNTPSLISHNTSHKSQKRLKDSSPKNGDGNRKRKLSPREEMKIRLCDYFAEISGHVIPEIETVSQGRAFGRIWGNPIYHIMKSVNDRENDAMALIQEAYKRLSKNGMTIKGPSSLIGTCDSIIAEVKRGVYKQEYSFESEMQKFMDWSAREVQSG
jgi:hypothetical protein